jgi:hypothetical protein
MDVEAIVWFGFRILSCRSTAKGAPWASFRSLGGFGGGKKKKVPKPHWGPLGVWKLRKPLSFGCIFSPLSAPLSPWAFYFPLGGLLSAEGPRPNFGIGVAGFAGGVSGRGKCKVWSPE